VRLSNLPFKLAYNPRSYYMVFVSRSVRKNFRPRVTSCSGVRMFVDTSDADSVRRCSVMCAEHKPIWRELSAPQLLSAWTQSNTARPHAQRTAARTFAVCRLYAYSYRHMSCDMRAGYSDIVLIATTEYFVCIDHISYHIFVYLTFVKTQSNTINEMSGVNSTNNNDWRETVSTCLCKS